MSVKVWVFLIIAAALAGAPAIGPEAEAARWAGQVMSKMTLEEKVGQIVFIDIAGAYVSDGSPSLDKWIALVRDQGLGGVVVYGGTPRDVGALLNRLQKVSKIPLLAAADFEGGPGQQVSGATEFPANMAFAAIGSDELMYRAARVGAVEGRAMGIHLTYSPVVDISTLPESPGESVRSFGGDLALLARMVRAYVRGYMDHGMLTTAKHFPGRGDVRPSSASPSFTWIDKPEHRLEREEMAAFRSAVQAGVPFVMSEHIAVPSLAQGSLLPASVEGRLVRHWLREKIGFQGILTTDDLWYENVTKRFGAVGVGIMALQAGHDLLLKPKDAAAMIRGVVDAVRKGELPEAHINQAVRKLLTWKARLNLHRDRLVDESRIASAVGNPMHLGLAQEVADRSLTLLKNDGVFPMALGSEAKVVNVSIQKLEEDPSPPALAVRLKEAFPALRSFTLRPGAETGVHDAALAAASSADLVVISLFVQRDKFGDPAPITERDLRLVERLIQLKRGKVIAMSYGNPHLVTKLDGVAAFAAGYGERGWFGNQSVYFESFVRLLKGEIKPQGVLPVRVDAKYPIGSGVRW